jgi:adenylate cyclase
MAVRVPRVLWRHYGVGIAALCWLVLATLQLVGAFEGLDLKLGDVRQQLAPGRRVSDRIAVIEVDDATVREYGRWPLPRSQYALLVTALEEAGARAIGLDLQFRGNDREDPSSDALLAIVASETPHLILALSFLSEPGPDGAAGATEDLTRHGLPAGSAPAPVASSVAVPYPELMASAHVLGHVTAAVDRDGVVRRIPFVIRYGDRLYLSLDLWAVGLADSETGSPRVEGSSHELSVVWPSGRTDHVPIDDDGTTAIAFSGDAAAFHNRASMLDVLQWYRSGQTERIARLARGRIVLIGTTAEREVTTDIGATPFSSNTPLLYLHANAVNAVARGAFLRPLDLRFYLALMAAVALALGWAFAALPLPRAVAVMSAAVIVLVTADYAAFAAAHVLVPTTFALLLPPLVYSAVESFRYVFLERHSRARDRELQVARKIQQKLLPTTPPESPALDMFGLNIPAQEVGGDYFDWVPLPGGGQAVALGDVSGKGVAAALLMSHLRASLHAESRGQGSPRAIVSAMHESMFRAVESGRFATFFLAAFPPDGDGFRFCNAGHNPALVVRAGRIEKLMASGLPLGMLDLDTYEEQTRAFDPGDVLVIYSDGVTECPWEDQQYGDERLEELVKRLATGSKGAREIALAIVDDVRAFCHGEMGADDVTILVVRRK